MAEDLKQKITFVGADQAVDALKGVADAQQKVVDGADKSASKTSLLAGKLNEVKGAVTGMVGAWLGMKGVTFILDTIIERLEKMREYQREITEKGFNVLQTTLPLATKIGDTSQSGQQKAAKIAAAIQEAGAMRDLNSATTLAMAAQDLGYDLRKGKNVSAIGKFASITNVRGYTADQQVSLLQMLSRAGIRNDTGWSGAVAKIGQASGAAGVSDDAVVAAMSGAGSTFFQTFGLDKGIELATMASKTIPGDQAARTLKAITRIAGVGASGTDARAYASMARTMGMDWKTLEPTGRLSVLSSMFGGSPEQVEKIKRRLGGDQLAEDLSVLFGTQGRSVSDAARSALTTGDYLSDEERVRDYRASSIGKQAIKSAMSASAASEMPFALMQDIRAKAETEIKRRGNTGQLAWLASDAGEYASVEAGLAAEELERARQDLESRGQHEAAKRLDPILYSLRTESGELFATDAFGSREMNNARLYQKGMNIYLNTTNVHGPIYNKPDPTSNRPDRIGGMAE